MEYGMGKYQLRSLNLWNANTIIRGLWLVEQLEGDIQRALLDGSAVFIIRMIAFRWVKFTVENIKATAAGAIVLPVWALKKR